MGIERKVTGLENLVTQVEEAKRALRLLERRIEELVQGMNGPQDAGRVMQEAGRLIDEQTAQYGNNAIVMTLVQDFRARMRARILK
jgi:hypothetical protein